MSGWELALVLFVAAIPATIAIVAIAWFCARSNRRAYDLARDMLKANLALHERPPTTQLAAAMEVTDRVEAEAEAKRFGIPAMNRRVPAGAS